MPNPATLARDAADTRIPGLPALATDTPRHLLSVPVYDPATDRTYQAPLGAGDGSVSANAVIGGHKQVQYRSSLFYQVPADATTLDRLVPATIVPDTLATVDNPSDTPFATTLPPRQYVATRTDPATPGAVPVPAYLGAAAGDTAFIMWVAVATGGGGAGTVSSVNGIGPDGQGNVQLPASGSVGPDSVQLTNTGSSSYVDVLLEQPTAQLASAIGLANYAGLQVQVINPATNAAFATESAYLPDAQASLTAAWATGLDRLLLRCQVLPLRNGLVAHARLLFTQPATSWPQSLAPHASAFRLYGNAFALQAVEWTHAGGMQVNGSNLLNAGASASATGSPQAAIQAGGGTGLLMAFEFTHNRNYQYDLVGLTDSLNPSDASFSAAFFIAQASTWSAYSGSTTLASGSLSNSNWRFRIEVYDDHVNWLLDGSVVYTLVGSLMADKLWPGVKIGSNSGITNCLVGGQVTSPR